MINLRPKFSLVDKITKINVARLRPLQKITLAAKLVGDNGEVFESHAHYIADKDGKVDVCRDSSLGGSYSGVEPMGLLWSMKQAPGQKKGLRLMKRDVTKPYNVEIKTFNDHIISPTETSLQPLSSAAFHKSYMADGVKRIPVKEGRIRGALFIPPGDGSFPGVIDILGGGGGLVEYKASLLASRGFAALALAYMNYDDLPNDPITDLDYFEEAADWLSRHPKVLPNGIGVHGICNGSLAALLMASFKFKTVKAVVAISPVLISRYVPFTYKGKISEVIPLDGSKRLITEEGGVWRYSHPTVTDYNVPVSKYSAVSPVENISCPVLLVYGTGDLNINPDFSVSHIRDSLKKQGKENLCSVLRYPNAGHIIEPPYTPHCYVSYISSLAPLTDDHQVHLVWGGEMKPHARAQEDAWPKILRFLRRNLIKKNEIRKVPINFRGDLVTNIAENLRTVLEQSYK